MKEAPGPLHFLTATTVRQGKQISGTCTGLARQHFFFEKPGPASASRIARDLDVKFSNPFIRVSKQCRMQSVARIT